jgi:adenylate cyclase class IV
MLSKCTQMCRIAFLVIIVSFAIYFVINNHKKPQKKQLQEGFANEVIEQPYRIAIMSVFNQLLQRDPHEYEVLYYRKMMNSPSDTNKVEVALRESGEFRDVLSRVNSQAKQANKDPSTQSLELLQKAMEMNELSKAASILDQVDKRTSSNTKTNPQALASEAIKGVDLSKRMDLYRSIVQVYERNLQRLPNMYELNFYTYQLIKEKDFNLTKLEMILQSSKEYEILQKNQTNTVYGDLPGNVTDAQLIYEVGLVYKQVFQDEPNRDMLNFLKHKYVQYQLDKNKLNKLLLTLRDIDKGKLMNESSNSNSNKTTSLLGRKTGPSDGQIFEDASFGEVQQTLSSVSSEEQRRVSATASVPRSQSSRRTRLTPLPPVYEEEDGDGEFDGRINVMDEQLGDRLRKVANPSTKDLDELLNTIDKPSVKAACRKNAYYDKEYRDELYDKLSDVNDIAKGDKTIRGRICSAQSQSPATAASTRLANFTQERNMEELKTTCARNSYFLNVDDNLGYEPVSKPNKTRERNVDKIVPVNWDLASAPTFGTFLEDANKTRVGSIMPTFVYKEYTNPMN